MPSQTDSPRNSAADVQKPQLSYAADVQSKLPHQRTAECLGKHLMITTPDKAAPDPRESLTTWLDRANGEESEGKPKLRLIIGESIGEFRRGSSEPFDPCKPRMVRAATSDGLFGGQLGARVHQNSGKSAQLDYDHLVDEWNETAQRVRDSHLIVIATGDVNMVAAYLYGLVSDLCFGDSSTTGFGLSRFDHRAEYKVEEKWQPIARGKGEGTDYSGVILLLKNPWNPNKRLLWVAGLSGIATAGGCRLLINRPKEYLANASKAVGVVYTTNHSKTAFEFKAWLCRGRDERLVWCPHGHPLPSSGGRPSHGPRVILNGESSPPIVLGIAEEQLTPHQYKVVEALLRAGEAGLSMEELTSITKVNEPHKVLRRLRAKSGNWNEVIQMAGRGWGRYRIV